jgi:hypothetical protein
MSNEHTEISDATRQAESEESQTRHVANRPVTPEEDAAMDEPEVNEDVRTHYREMVELGAQEVGEGRIP